MKDIINMNENEIIDVGGIYYNVEELPPPEKDTQELLDVLCNDQQHPFMGQCNSMSNVDKVLWVNYDDIQDTKNIDLSDWNEDAEVIFTWSSTGECIKEDENSNSTVPVWKAEKLEKKPGLQVDCSRAQGSSQEQMVCTPDVMKSVMELQQSFPSPTSQFYNDNNTKLVYDGESSVYSISDLTPQTPASSCINSTAGCSSSSETNRNTISTADRHKKGRGRGRPRKEVRTTFDEERYKGLSKDEKKYKMLRDKNNEASRRSRLNRTKKVRMADKEVRQLERRHRRLKEKLKHVESLSVQMKKFLMEMLTGA